MKKTKKKADRLTAKVTLQLRPADAKRLKREAEAEGLPLTAHLRRILAKHLRGAK